MLLEFLGEDESDAFLVCCGGIHAFAATMAFQMFDFFAVIATIGIYSWLALNSPSWTNIFPIVTLAISLASFPLGPVGLYRQKKQQLRIYHWRLRLITAFSILWMFICIFVQEEAIGILVALIWLTAAVLYLFGSNFCSTTLAFFDDYKGYDGADPEMIAKYENRPI